MTKTRGLGKMIDLGKDRPQKRIQGKTAKQASRARRAVRRTWRPSLMPRARLGEGRHPKQTKFLSSAFGARGDLQCRDEERKHPTMDILDRCTGRAI